MRKKIMVAQRRGKSDPTEKGGQSRREDQNGISSTRIFYTPFLRLIVSLYNRLIHRIQHHTIP
jgi:hypothetical protein